MQHFMSVGSELPDITGRNSAAIELDRPSRSTRSSQRCFREQSISSVHPTALECVVILEVEKALSLESKVEVGWKHTLPVQPRQGEARIPKTGERLFCGRP